MGEYENTLKEIENTLGKVPGFMMFFSREKLVKDWPSWKKNCCSEIYLERACYLLCADEMLEERLGEKKVTINAGITPEQVSEMIEQ